MRVAVVEVIAVAAARCKGAEETQRTLDPRNP